MSSFCRFSANNTPASPMATAALSSSTLSLSYVNARQWSNVFHDYNPDPSFSVAIGKRSRGAAIGLLFYDHGISHFLPCGQLHGQLMVDLL